MDRKETEEALEEARRGGLKRFDSVEVPVRLNKSPKGKG